VLFRSPNLSLIYALDYQLNRMLAEGARKRYERHLAMAEYTRIWAQDHKIEMFPEKGYESLTVSTMKNSLGKNIGDLNKELGKRGYQIGNGYGKLKDQTFRIGHMGDWAPEDIKGLLWHIEDVWGL
jgi:aspartate aminotransferase-like enzyme